MIEIRHCALAAAAAAMLLAGAARAETVLTFGGSDAVGSLLDRQNAMFAQLVNQRANGELTVNFISGEALGNDIQVIEQMMEARSTFMATCSTGMPTGSRISRC